MQLERIYLLPDSGAAANAKDLLGPNEDAPIYVPVSLARVSPQIADELRAGATEAWVNRAWVPRQRSLSAHLIGLDDSHIHLEKV
jgi:hypothetical protein